MTATGLERRKTQFVNEYSTIWPTRPNDWAVFCVLIRTVHLTVCSSHVIYRFQIEFTFYSCLNIKELLAQSRRESWSLSDCNWTQTQIQLVRKRRLNHLVNLAKWLSCILSVRLRAKLFWVPGKMLMYYNMIIIHIRIEIKNAW